MKILSISTSSKICAVSILGDKKVIKENILDNGLTHSEKLMPLIKQTLEETSLTLDDINLFACDKGPGSFTGIRIGISTLKAFSDSKGITSIGITSLEALARNVKNAEYICSLIDARNSQCYFGFFKLENEKYILKKDYIADDINVLLNNIKNYKNITFVGDGAIIHKDLILNNFADAKFAKDNLINSTNIGIAAFEKFFESSNFNEELEPFYLRKSQAERMLKNT